VAKTNSKYVIQPSNNPESIVERYRNVRGTSESICEPLEIEDYCIQSMPDVSPTKWHLAHTSWFFETFLLKKVLSGYESPNSRYESLFNSYYNTVGEPHTRASRGLLSRPTVAEVMDYRAHVDDAMTDLLNADERNNELNGEVRSVIEIGLHHEQQHQELMLMDVKHVFSCNPLRPAYRELPPTPQVDVPPMNWIPFEGHLQWIGHDGVGFAFDNELPRHRAYVQSFQIADRLVTCGEYLNFVDDAGYRRPELWLSDGWSVVQSRKWQAPLYWRHEGDNWRLLTLGGMRDLNPNQPVSHVSYYEADAFARWQGCWLPRENAWEAVASELLIEGNFLERSCFQPMPPASDRIASPANLASRVPSQMFGDLWEWTCSPYSPYPGYRPPAGVIGEYNGKFMCNQFVLRGGSYATPRSHIRATYRNFYPPDARWPFTGIRLAKELT